MIKREWGAESNREATAPIKTLVKLQSCFLSLQWKTCLLQNCSLGSFACIEGPALWQNTLIMSKGKGVPFTGHEGPQVDVDARVHIYAATALERGRVVSLMFGYLHPRGG